MLEPSNPSPSLKLSTSSSPSGRLKCCQVPGRSMKRTSTTSTPSALARSKTSRGLVLLTDFVSTAMNTLHENLRFDGPEGDRRKGVGTTAGGVGTKRARLFPCYPHEKGLSTGRCLSCDRDEARHFDSWCSHVSRALRSCLGSSPSTPGGDVVAQIPTSKSTPARHLDRADGRADPRRRSRRRRDRRPGGRCGRRHGLGDRRRLFRDVHAGD